MTYVSESRIFQQHSPRPTLRDAGLWFILTTLAGITLLHYLTDIHLIPYHSIYRSLYYLPIAVAAVRYGRAGGTVTALATIALYLPHVVLSWGIMFDDGFNDLLETVVFLFVGVLAGTLADAERRQRLRAQDAAAQLTTTNMQLQQQADLAERTRAEIESILESSDSGVVTVDCVGQVTRVNRAARVLLDEADGVRAPLHPVVRSYLADDVQSYQQHRVASRTLGLHGAPLIGARGETVGMVLVLDNLTDMKALEEQVQRAERLAALGRLAGGLAHEIRNPLGITRAAAQMLQQHLHDQPRLSEYTDVIQTEIDRVDRLIEQLLVYARPRPLQHATVHVDTLIEHMVRLTQAYAEQHGVLLETNLMPDLPVVSGDDEQLHQALVNLVLNGVQATPAGGSVCVIANTRRNTHDQTLLGITVRDSGRGIPADDLPHIFDPFFTTRPDGTGLGLSIVQQIVQEHGGTLHVQSTPGVGTSFVLLLPALSQQGR